MPQEKEIFDAARRIDDVASRAVYLSDACGSETSLRQRVEALLSVHDDQKSFLATPAESATIDLDPPLLFTAPGTVVEFGGGHHFTGSHAALSALLVDLARSAEPR